MKLWPISKSFIIIFIGNIIQLFVTATDFNYPENNLQYSLFCKALHIS